MCEMIERQVAEYYNLSERFAKQGNDYNQQYFRIYTIRLDKMTKYLLHEIEKKWKDEYLNCKLYKLSENNYGKCVVIGTLFKNQKLKPSVLKQLAESSLIVAQPIVTHRTDESDTLHIEDELQRFQLEGCFDPKLLVTGIPVALLGQDIGGGIFEVNDYTFAGYRTQVERPIPEDDCYVVFISGLDLINIQKYNLSLKLIVSWLSGFLGDLQDVHTSKIIRVIIAGNSIQKSADREPQKFSLSTRTIQATNSVDAVKTLDAFLLELCQVIDVDVMPGENDPSNHILPQKILHHCLFPNSIAYKSLNRVTNPYECQVSGSRFLGTSGQPINDILRYSDITEPMEALENCLKWNHLAPTAPDTLGCFPYYDEDPFIIEECPHVLFVGNQLKFDTKIATGQDGQTVRLICVPEFSSTYSACILNLKNLNCFPIVFHL